MVEMLIPPPPPSCKIKKFGEMARKLRFFKEQMEKAGVTPSTKPMTQTEIDVDDLEVCYKVECAARNVLDGPCPYYLALFWLS